MGLQTACLLWMKQRTNLEKTLMSISVILLFTCILLVLVGFAFKQNSEEVETSVCLSTGCYQTTGEILSRMDPLVDPCEDYYDYSCGNFVKTHAVPLDNLAASVEQISSDSVQLQLKRWLELPPGTSNGNAFIKARNLYRTCMDYGSQENSAKYLILSLIKNQLNGVWPTLEVTQPLGDELLEKFLSSLISLGIPVVFQLDVVPDSSNPNKYVTRISPGSPFFSQYHPDDLRGNPALHSYLVAALTILGVRESALKIVVDEMLQVDYRFLMNKEKADKECGYQDEFKDDLGIRRVNFTALDQLMGTKLNWSSLLSETFRDLDMPKVFPVEVYCRRYIRDYTEFLYDLHPSQIYNYLAMRFFLTLISHLGPSFHNIHRNYIAHYASSNALHPFQARWKECIFLLEKYMLPVMATAYSQGIPEAVQKEGKRIASSIKSRFHHLLSSMSWIEEHKRKWIKQKISKVEFEIALMKYSQNASMLDRLYSKLNLSQDNFVNNIVSLQMFTISSRLQKLVSHDGTDVLWQNMTFMSPGHYQHHEGLISVQFDKITSPFLRLDQPGSLNYGSYGFFLSRELVHYAFHPAEIDETLATCLSNQYSHYNIEKINVKVDGSKTLIENFVDNIAHFIAYEAYQKYNKNSGGDLMLPGFHHSDNQNFFLSFAQAFCEVRDIDGYKAYVNSSSAPAKVRVNEILRNFREFASVYGCAVGSPMNPSEKCVF